jgi:tRNA pseudouridine38-40 synthase
MPRIAFKLEYKGKNFSGSQYQVGVRTVQGELEKALSTFARSPITAIFSGRTDAGVHAKGQVVHCNWPDEEPLDLWRFCWALNGILDRDASVVVAQVVPEDFHARFSATERSYVYKVLNRPNRSALLSETYHFIPQKLDVDSMREAASAVLGEHDFTAFKSTNSDRVSSVCRVTRAELLSLGEGLLEFHISANHFVYNMVRIIVGTLIEIGLGKKQSGSLREALETKERDLAGPTAPPWGLCLDSIEYPEAYKLFKPGVQEAQISTLSGDQL